MGGIPDHMATLDIFSQLIRPSTKDVSAMSSSYECICTFIRISFCGLSPYGRSQDESLASTLCVRTVVQPYPIQRLRSLIKMALKYQMECLQFIVAQFIGHCLAR